MMEKKHMQRLLLSACVALPGHESRSRSPRGI